jgi:hypothetical protein
MPSLCCHKKVFIFSKNLLDSNLIKVEIQSAFFKSLSLIELIVQFWSIGVLYV